MKEIIKKTAIQFAIMATGFTSVFCLCIAIALPFTELFWPIPILIIAGLFIGNIFSKLIEIGKW